MPSDTTSKLKKFKYLWHVDPSFKIEDVTENEIDKVELTAYADECVRNAEQFLSELCDNLPHETSRLESSSKVIPLIHYRQKHHLKK